MSDTQSDIVFHARTYHGFLMGLRWALMWVAASLTTIIAIFAHVNIILAFIAGSVAFAVLAYLTRHVFLNPHEHEVEALAGMPPPSR